MIKTVFDEEFGNLRVDDHEVFDADQAIFFARQLEYIKAKSYDVKYADLKFRSLFPVSHEAPPGTRTITYRTYDKVGMAKVIGSYAQDLPRADIGGKEESLPVREIALSIGYTQAEIRSAALTGMPLDARRMAAAMRGHEQTMNSIVWKGDSDSGLIGLFNHPNLSISTVADNAGGTSTLWANKTPDEILKDLNAIANDIWSDTKMVEVPDTLLLPPDKYLHIASTARTALSDTTILQFFLNNQKLIKRVEPVNELSGAGTSGADVMVAYRQDADVATVEIPMEVIFHPEERRGLEILIPSEASIAGLLIYYPMSFSLREGI